MKRPYYYDVTSGRWSSAFYNFCLTKSFQSKKTKEEEKEEEEKNLFFNRLVIQMSKSPVCFVRPCVWRVPERFFLISRESVPMFFSFFSLSHWPKQKTFFKKEKERKTRSFCFQLFGIFKKIKKIANKKKINKNSGLFTLLNAKKKT
jgi:hypothetical protein